MESARPSSGGAMRTLTMLRTRKARRGIVLLDVVLALAVMALAAYVLMPVPTGSLSRNDVMAEAVRVGAVFRQGRTMAIRDRSPTDVVVDVMTGEIEGPGEIVSVRQDIRLVWSTSSQCPLDRGRRALRFLPDGRSCGGVLSLSGSGHEALLRVDWLTGRVEMTAR
jgi:general secretion pathway protein H